MKTTHYNISSVVLATGAACLALCSSAAAIENPGAAASSPKEQEQKKREAVQNEGQQQDKEAKPVAWLGLGGSPVSEPLGKHLGLEPGTGLTIFHVCRDSAADKAGFKMHDVIVEFDGKKIGTLNELADAVRAREPGDEVVVKVIQKGETQGKKVVLGERNPHHNLHERPDEDNDPRWRGMGHLPRVERGRLEQLLKEDIKEMRKELEMQKDLLGNNREQLIEEMEKLLEDKDVEIPGMMRLLKRLNLQLPDDEKPEDNRKDFQFNFKAQASATIMDEEGSVTMKTVNGVKEVIVKDRAGNVVFEGPYQTEQDKAALPDGIRQRVENFNFNFGARKGHRN